MVEHQSGTLRDEAGDVDVPLSGHKIPMPEGVTTPVDGMPIIEEFTPEQVEKMTDALREEQGNDAGEDPDLAEPLDEETQAVLPDLDTENWMSKLEDGEIFNADKGPAPRLHGLRRLAKPYILCEESKVNALIIVPREHVRTLETSNGEDNVMSKTEVVSMHNFPMASVTFSITLRDGRTFSDSADAFYSNCEALGLFPTAVASARAEARCLRKVLGIREHAAEELVDKDPSEELAPDDQQPIKPEQAKLIDKILKSIDLTLKELLEEITTREVHSVEELTTSEARKALRLLNDKKKKKKRSTKKS